MSEEKNKVIDVKTSVVVKKSQGFKEVAHKAHAGLSEAEAIERFTVGNIDDEDEQEREAT